LIAEETEEMKARTSDALRDPAFLFVLPLAEPEHPPKIGKIPGSKPTRPPRKKGGGSRRRTATSPTASMNASYAPAARPPKITLLVLVLVLAAIVAISYGGIYLNNIAVRPNQPSTQAPDEIHKAP
jgi:hypothetical protein